MSRPVRASHHLSDVRYEIRGELARRADDLQRSGYDVVRMNIGNPGAFGFQMPEAMRRAMIENLGQSEAYCHEKGVFPAREAVAMQQQERGVPGVSAEDVFMGNGVSELTGICMEALLDPGDEVLVPSPDYPLWTAAVTLHGARAVHYPNRPEAGFVPDPAAVERLITERTKALVIINPNNPTGAVYPREVLSELARLAERHGLTVFADEIYDGMLYEDAEFVPMATLVHDTLCATLSGLSKVYRACGLRVGWCSFSGRMADSREYLRGVELLCSLRLCSNVPGQWAVQTALGGHQSIKALTAPGGRLYESRKAAIEAVQASSLLQLSKPMGAMYAFVGVDKTRLRDFDDQAFARALLEREHVLLAPGCSFNVDYHTHFRTTLLPDAVTQREVFRRIERTLNGEPAAGP